MKLFRSKVFWFQKNIFDLMWLEKYKQALNLIYYSNQTDCYLWEKVIRKPKEVRSGAEHMESGGKEN
jgi:hypothetical protein